MKKQNFEEPQVEVIQLDAENVIVASGEGNTETLVEEDFEM